MITTLTNLTLTTLTTTTLTTTALTATALETTISSDRKRKRSSQALPFGMHARLGTCRALCRAQAGGTRCGA